jgi:hypothetical protein
MLDVLEHCPEPGKILDKLRRRGVEGVLVKVPMLHGPLGMLSRSFCHMKQLFRTKNGKKPANLLNHTIQ